MDSEASNQESLWMVARSVWTTLASRPGEQEGVPLGPVVVATLEVEGTRAMEMADMTVDLEDMATDMDMEGPETMAAEARVVMTATQEEITGTITTTEMRQAHLIYTGIKPLIQDHPSKWLFVKKHLF
ncbi:RNA-binding protein 3 isoform X3 [Phacochoerus africanus]|uniref:RNA-binding protein 3 isoform X3 n=1 Tax=Phacochoerus africanus TaxID=41426 RepID=UPI001FD8FDB1|nr:RNA-binding protein 3 isoform X3 [Phacochoerus africanus]